MPDEGEKRSSEMHLTWSYTCFTIVLNVAEFKICTKHNKKTTRKY